MQAFCLLHLLTGLLRVWVLVSAGLWDQLLQPVQPDGRVRLGQRPRLHRGHQQLHLHPGEDVILSLGNIAMHWFEQTVTHTDHTAMVLSTYFFWQWNNDNFLAIERRLWHLLRMSDFFPTSLKWIVFVQAFIAIVTNFLNETFPKNAEMTSGDFSTRLKSSLTETNGFTCQPTNLSLKLNEIEMNGPFWVEKAENSIT